jgi:hypothetical protein
MEDKMAEEKQVSKEAYALGEIITGVEAAILVNGKPITMMEAIVEILNKLDRLEKSIV